MADYTIEDVFEEVYRREFAEFDDLESLPDPHPSLRHKIRMNRIFKRFRKNTAKLYAVHIRFSRRTVLAFLMIILLATISACAAIKIIGDFLYEVHEDNTQLRVADAGGAPEFIEDIYEITALPEGYVCTTETFIKIIHTYIFTKESTGETLTLCQMAKPSYNGHYDNEGFILQDIKIDGQPAIFIDYSEDDTICGLLIWDNGEYIFELVGYYTKDELIDMAKSIKIIC